MPEQNKCVDPAQANESEMCVCVCPCACAASPGKRLEASCLRDLKTSHMRGGQLELDCVIDVKSLCT